MDRASVIMIRVEINSVDVTLPGSDILVRVQGLTFSIADDIAAGDAVLPVVIKAGTSAPAKRETVEIYDDDDLLWAGYIETVSDTLLPAMTHREGTITARYVGSRLNEIRVWMRKTDTKVGTWITDLNTDWLSGEGFTVSADDGPLVKDARVFSGASALSVLRELTRFASQSGYVFRLSVSPAKVITFEEEDSAASVAFAITDDDGRARVGSLMVNPHAGPYANIFEAEGLPGSFDTATFELTRKEAETRYGLFGERPANATGFRVGGTPKMLGRSGVADSDASTADVLWEDTYGTPFTRLVATSGSWVATEQIEIDAEVFGTPRVIVLDADEITANGRVWGEMLRVEARSVAHLTDQARAILALRTRSSAERVGYTVDMVTSAERDQGMSLLPVSDRPNVGETQTVTRSELNLSSWSGRVASVRAEVRSPTLVAYTVELWSGQAAETVAEREATLYGPSASGRKEQTDLPQTAEPTLTHPALFDDDVITTQATTWTFTAA